MTERGAGRDAHHLAAFGCLRAFPRFRYLEPEWEDTATFVAFKEAMRVQELEDSCCMDCNTCENPHEIERPDECKALPGFMGLPVHTAMEQELMILGAGILAGMHLACVSAQQRGRGSAASLQQRDCVTSLRNAACDAHPTLPACNCTLYSGARCCWSASGAGVDACRQPSTTPLAASTDAGWPRTRRAGTAGGTWIPGYVDKRVAVRSTGCASNV